jgi:hypothetical protein
MTYIDRDSEGLLIPSSNIKSLSPYHLSVADWGDVFIEIGFVKDTEGVSSRDSSSYKHTNDPTLRLRFDSKISLITIFKADEKIAYVHILSNNSLIYLIRDLLDTIRGLYATNH